MSTTQAPRRLFAAINNLATETSARSFAAQSSPFHARTPCTLLGTRPCVRLNRKAGANFIAHSQTSRSICSSPILRKADTSATTPAPPLPILPRPLGVQDPPSTASKTWQEKKDELLDRDRHLAKRKALVKEATQGYFHDFHEIRREGGHGGKSWTAPPVLIRQDKALYFPNIQGTSLASRKTTHTTDLFKGRISIVTVLTARVSEEHANSFVADVLEDWEEDPLFRYVQLFVSGLKRSIPEHRWSGYMIAGGEWGGLKEPLGITNKHVGYIYLVDPDCKIRWAGNAYATEEERQGLRKAVAVLMARVREGKESSAVAPVIETSDPVTP
ncbi:hypothetical protein QFC22_000168 [Naganishia vaughanmartiniae]|uniref:Uncharacterized protein n=1 Tax=Naganishia vaughanmartiniae TaxID=1424756 RepID=A0ACC2XMB4_9TREE|nr:hypothetical protein QFC22_000168 [Naganishia vaughanmartiniae]